MKSTFANYSSFLDSTFSKFPSRNAPIKDDGKAGNDEFMKWMSSFNPSLLSKYPSLSKESQSKLRSLYILNLQADSSIDEVVKNMNRCECDYEALTQKTFSHLQLIGLGEEEELRSETHQFLQASAAFVTRGNVGDGSDAGAVATLAADFLTQANISRQRSSLNKDIQMIEKRNERLKENLRYFEREFKMAAKEVTFQQTKLNNLTIDLHASQANISKSVYSELDEIGRGISPAVSNQAIFDIYQTYKTLLIEINHIKGKLNKYDELQPSITESTKLIAKMKQHLESVAQELKIKLTSFLPQKR